MRIPTDAPGFVSFRPGDPGHTAPDGGLAQAPQDPFLFLQWNIEAINVRTAWTDYTGAGVRVGLNDHGVHYDHADLNRNYDTSSDYDFEQRDTDPHPQDLSEFHGTFVGGVIGATANNEGIIGVASGATLVSHRGLSFHPKYDVDISNNSWGFIQPFANIGFLSDFDNLLTAVRDSRDGHGMVVVTSSGNGRMNGDSSNYDLFANARQTITVAALDTDFTQAAFSEAGANVLVTAPGVDIVSTYPGNAYAIGSGTSYSAPAVSGVAALMLEANPLLGYRDVQEILALSASQVDADGAGWSYSGAGNWNGGGLHFNNAHGFGLVNAHGAVRLAEHWHTQSTAANEVMAAYSEIASRVLPDNATFTTRFSLQQDIDIDAVEMDIRLLHPDTSNLIVRLVSPEGTSSILVDRPGLIPDAAGATAFQHTSIDFTLTSMQFLGETSKGDWTLEIQDAGGWNGSGLLQHFAVRAFGDDISDNNVYYYTDTFAETAAGDGQARQVLSDLSGIDTINAAQVTSSSNIDLRTGSVSRIDNTDISYTNGTHIENAIAGDGNDTLRGNELHNELFSGRGDDLIIGGNGDDWLNGGRGSDNLRGGNGTDTVDYSGSNDSVIADLRLGQFLYGDAHGDSVSSIENLQGSRHSDHLHGNGSDNNLSGGEGMDRLYGWRGDDTLLGGAGEDILVGGAGDDLMHGGSDIDRAVYEGNLARYDLSLRGENLYVINVDHSNAEDFGHDRLVSVEQLIFDDVAVILNDDGRYIVEDAFFA